MPFSGWALPVQYKEGLVAEHLHCRNEAVIFDVSHMMQSKIEGKDQIKLAEVFTVGRCLLRVCIKAFTYNMFHSYSFLRYV